MPELPPIKGFQSNTMLDWPGRISAILFLPNCNFRCPFCHAGDLVTKPETLPEQDFATIEEVLRQRTGWLDGVVVTGGEPTLWGDRLGELLRRIKRLGLGVKLDSNGTHPDVLEKLIAEHLLEAVSMDIKGPLDERYAISTGVECDLAPIQRSIEMLRNAPIEVEFRTTVCPGLHDVDFIADAAKGIAGEDTIYFLQGFRPAEDCLDPNLRTAPRADQAFMEKCAVAAMRWTPKVLIRGRFDFKPANCA